ncbi:MAG: DUF512 domain-containing protein [Oscillospiraceae bacterium]|nr:DUF512 domain-containing protein [Oscillospiraceae bacterium]
MAHRIAQVLEGGVAARAGICPGDVLLSVNGEAVLDQVDYQFLTARPRLTLALQGADGQPRTLNLRKGAEEPLGLTFEDTLMSRPRTCANHCAFCFIDQMPPGLRRSLYVKDDDWRLSLMMGNYITLTNVPEAEFARIIARRASPLYISVHATNPAVRAKLMGNPRAADLLERLKRLRDAGLSFHCQIVLCPGLNDGVVLDETLETLSGLAPAAKSAALVPVGLTRFREGLTALAPYTMETARAVMAQAAAWQAKLLPKLHTRFVFPADEFYCLSGAPLPPEEAYEGYPQLENGVGLLSSFAAEFKAAYALHDDADTLPRRVLIATGVSAAPFLRELLASHPLPGVDIRVLAVENRFFGTTVTVAGLLTGQDVLAALQNEQADEVLISRAMLRHEGDLFLDDMPLETLAQGINMPVRPVECDGAAFLDALQGISSRED